MSSLSIHPGEILQEEFLVPYKLTASDLARRLGMPANRVTSIVNGTRSVTPETAIIFAHAFGTSPQFWINIQSRYDLERAAAGVDPARIERATALHRQLEPEVA